MAGVDEEPPETDSGIFVQVVIGCFIIFLFIIIWIQYKFNIAQMIINSDICSKF